MTHTEQIVVAICAGLGAAGINCRTDISNPFSFEDMPGIVVDCGNESPRPIFGSGAIDWDLSITLWVIAMADTSNPAPKLAPEPTRKTAHEWLMANRNLGGLVMDINPSSVNRVIDPENPAAGVTEAVYRIQYRTQEETI